MGISEKVAYLKGHIDGMELDENKKETKIFSLIINVLEEISLSYSDLRKENEELKELLDILDEDLGYVEEVVFNADDECDCDCHCHGDEMSVHVVCPNCSENIYIDEEILNEGEIGCPNCGKEFDFDLDDVIQDDEDSNEEEMPF